MWEILWGNQFKSLNIFLICRQIWSFWHQSRCVRCYQKITYFWRNQDIYLSFVSWHQQSVDNWSTSTLTSESKNLSKKLEKVSSVHCDKVYYIQTMNQFHLGFLFIVSATYRFRSWFGDVEFWQSSLLLFEERSGLAPAIDNFGRASSSLQRAT